MEDWEDEAIPDLLKKEQPKNNWDDEDLDDDNVKDSWEDEDEPAPAPAPEPKAEPPPPVKSPNKPVAKSSEKKEKVEPRKDAVLDPIEEKFRQQRLVEEADLKTAAELFGKRGDEKTLDNFIPKTESDFAEYAELISHKLRPYEMPKKLLHPLRQLLMKRSKQKRKLMLAKRRQLERKNNSMLASPMMM
ncbi:uncharacterized protein LOC127249668 isoform X2 [Andrographis paniculata]|uniref:uncharacterized protein LOC127249668 isoform X2 n=1 Tax=Andrographis paniculata TaxID=175694 RepID=UPI0021E974C4|nr:uncharacterized protein LOC127249668 isoform X2 [Andrographis paniculata]